MLAAMKKVEEGVSVNRAAAMYSVPKRTLELWMIGSNGLPKIHG